MPRFVAMYADLGAALPLPTRVLLSIVDHFYIALPALAGVVVLTAWGWRRWLANDAGRRQFAHLRERLPYFGELARIYRYGVLMYGQRPSLGKLAKLVRMK